MSEEDNPIGVDLTYPQAEQRASASCESWGLITLSKCSPQGHTLTQKPVHREWQVCPFGERVN